MPSSGSRSGSCSARLGTAQPFAFAHISVTRDAEIDFPPRANSEVPSGVRANRGGHGVPPEVVQAEVGAVLKHVRTIQTWAPDSQPASLYLVLFRKP